MQRGGHEHKREWVAGAVRLYMRLRTVLSIVDLGTPLSRFYPQVPIE